MQCFNKCLNVVRVLVHEAHSRHLNVSAIFRDLDEDGFVGVLTSEQVPVEALLSGRFGKRSVVKRRLIGEAAARWVAHETCQG